MHLVIDSLGAKLSVYRGRFLLQCKEKIRKEYFSPVHISHISLTNSCSVTTQAMFLAIENQIPILLIDRLGEPKGMIWSHYYGSIATIRRGQLAFSRMSSATDWMLEQFRRKVEGQKANLQLFQSVEIDEAVLFMEKQRQKLDKFKDMPLNDKVRNEIMGFEGSIAARYFQTLSAHLPPEYSFEKRSRPAEDAFNAALNYLYGMLYHLSEQAVLSSGLDPYLPIFHRDGYLSKGFVFDFIEPYRPLVDKILIEMCQNQCFKVYLCEKISETSVRLRKENRHELITSFDSYFNYKIFHENRMISRKEWIKAQAAELAQKLWKMYEK